MADTSLSAALQGLATPTSESPYAMALSGLSLASPNLITPYTSPGASIGIGLGTMLANALLGHMAKRDALNETLATNKYANEMLSAPSSMDRTGYLENLAAQGVGSSTIGKLSTLGAALAAQQRMNLATQQAKEQETKSDLLKAFGVAGINAGTLSLSPEGTLQPVTVPEGELSPKEMRDVQKARLIAQAQAEAKAPAQKAKDQKEQAGKDFTHMRLLANDLASDKRVKNFQLVKAKMMAMESEFAKGSRASIDAMLTNGQQIIQPDSVVTLGEQKKAEDAQSTLDKWRAALANVANPNSRLVEQARREVLEVARDMYEAQAKNYNEATDDALKQGRELGIGDINRAKLKAPRAITGEDKSNLLKIQAFLNQDKTNIAAGKPSISEATKLDLLNQLNEISGTE